MDTYASFKQRSDAIRLTAFLKDIRIASTIINTPDHIGGGCGLSVLFSNYYADGVRKIINERNLKSFIGIFYK